MGYRLRGQHCGNRCFSPGLRRRRTSLPEAKEQFIELGRHAAEPTAIVTFGKAIFAGWIIALLVWLLPLAGSAKPFVILGLTYLVSLGELAHIIAGSVEVAYAAFAGAATWGEYLTGFLLPTLLGNVVGGVGRWRCLPMPRSRRRVIDFDFPYRHADLILASPYRTELTLTPRSSPS